MCGNELSRDWTRQDQTSALIKAGANVNLRNVITSRTPLHGAASNGDCEVTKLLLAAKADPKIKVRARCRR